MIDTLSHLAWREPLWLWLALYPWVLWGLRATLGRTRGKNYAEAHLLPWAQAATVDRLQLRCLWRHGVLVIAWLMFAMAMAGPRLAQNVYDLDREHYAQLMVVIDVSRSMTARDLAPGRLERARLELEDLTARAEQLKIGLVVYAARPHLLIPATHDKAVIRHGLASLHHGLLPTEGSNLPAAIDFAAEQLGSDELPRALLLVTDGELPADSADMDKRLDDRVSELAQQGVTVYALGIGSTEGSPLYGPEGGWLQYRDEPVLSRLHEDRLQRLTLLGNGRYARVTDTDADWRILYDEAIGYLQTAEGDLSDDRLIEWRELYAWFLLPGLLLLLLAYVDTRVDIRPDIRKQTRRAAIAGFGLFLLGGLLQPPAAQAAAQADKDALQQQAYEAYRQQSWQQARQAYARIEGYAGRMGEGGSAYRLEEYQAAIQLFTQAVLDADTDTQRARAVFNLANSYYQLQDYGMAASLYQETLRYAPQDEAAQLNLSFALTLQQQQQAQSANERSARQGRGSRTGRPLNNTDVTDGQLSLDNEAEHTQSPNIPAMPGNRQSPVKDIIELGIHESRPVVGQASAFKDPNWQYAVSTPQRIASEIDTLSSDESKLWQRLFEQEEGFPAPLESPRELPDTRPW